MQILLVPDESLTPNLFTEGGLIIPGRRVVGPDELVLKTSKADLVVVCTSVDFKSFKELEETDVGQNISLEEIRGRLKRQFTNLSSGDIMTIIKWDV